MLPTLVRRLAQAAKPQLNAAAANATKLKKVWPPDMKTMSTQQQLHFEKKYKRRVKLATARPQFDKAMQLAQLFTMALVVGYMALFMDWNGVPTPFDPLRENFYGFFGAFTKETKKLELREHHRPPQPESSD
ncbi:hypothetical protein BT67DRAFT_440618 [Trichocladium antarcticum]|uniref:Uncharacterized protein n=1 Tax=Trichocladium antarcticum TaxID=1450529 RepID=A0AAN6UN00_9PEZI|nr:hypothetical protein BT67DRAFT_440618 [Trichocladium antarcticum]